jgi:hypothetical protein
MCVCVCVSLGFGLKWKNNMASSRIVCFLYVLIALAMEYCKSEKWGVV